MKRSGAKGDSLGSGLDVDDDEDAAFGAPFAASEKEARWIRGAAISRVGDVEAPKEWVVMEAMVCCT